MASANANLHKAKDIKNDEFYTQLTDITKELIHYKDHFQDKVVLCNCDDPTWSMFWKYFHLNFAEFGLKKLISTHYDREEATYKMEYTGGNDNDIEVGIKTPLKDNGDFRNQECLDLLDECDIVVTNPPFSLFREYINMLISSGKKFVILGNMNALKYKEIFPFVKERKLWLGVNNGSMEFRVPDYVEKDNVYKRGNAKYAKFGNICWYTNMEHYRIHEPLELNAKYITNEKKYPKYDNYNAIEVGKLDNIPYDYFGIMGVPITIVQKLNPHQFEIVGEFNHGCDNKYDLAAPILNGKQLFPRIAVRRCCNV